VGLSLRVLWEEYSIPSGPSGFNGHNSKGKRGEGMGIPICEILNMPLFSPLSINSINLFCQMHNQIADIIMPWQATRKTEVQLAGGL